MVHVGHVLVGWKLYKACRVQFVKDPFALVKIYTSGTLQHLEGPLLVTAFSFHTEILRTTFKRASVERIAFGIAVVLGSKVSEFSRSKEATSTIGQLTLCNHIFCTVHTKGNRSRFCLDVIAVGEPMEWVIAPRSLWITVSCESFFDVEGGRPTLCIIRKHEDIRTNG